MFKPIDSQKPHGKLADVTTYNTVYIPDETDH